MRRHPAEKLMDPVGQRMIDWTFRGMLILGMLLFVSCVSCYAIWWQ